MTKMSSFERELCRDVMSCDAGNNYSVTVEMIIIFKTVFFEFPGSALTENDSIRDDRELNGLNPGFVVGIVALRQLAFKSYQNFNPLLSTWETLDGTLYLAFRGGCGLMQDLM